MIFLSTIRFTCNLASCAIGVQPYYLIVYYRKEVG